MPESILPASFPRLLLMLFLSVSWLSGCDTSSDTSEPDSSILVDGRTLQPATPDASWQSHPAVLLAAESARVHWQAHNTAFEDDFRVMDTAIGSFTRKDAEQHAILYLSSLWPRCCTNMGVLIIEDDGLVMNALFEGSRQQLSPVGDLDHDGQDELMLIGSFGMGGNNETGMQIISFRNNTVVPLASYSLATDGCATMREDSRKNAWVISLEADPEPVLSAEHFSTTCEDSGWLSEGVTDSLPFPDPALAAETENFIILER